MYAPESAPVANESDVQDLDFVATELAIGSGVDPMEALLGLTKTADKVEETFLVKLVDGTEVPWTVRPVTDEEIDETRERNTRLVKRGRGGKVQELDETAMGHQLIALATVKPDLTDARLAQKYRARRPEEIVKVAFLPGTAQAIVAKIMDVSGYSDELVAVGKS